MKKILIRLFVLDYVSKFRGKVVSYPRAAAIIFPLLLLTFLMHMGGNTFWVLPATLSILALICGFALKFVINIDSKLFSLSQSWQYSKYKFKDNIDISFSKEDLKSYEDMLESKDYYNFIGLFFVPVVSIVLLFLFL